MFGCDSFFCHSFAERCHVRRAQDETLSLNKGTVGECEMNQTFSSDNNRYNGEIWTRPIWFWQLTWHCCGVMRRLWHCFEFCPRKVQGWNGKTTLKYWDISFQHFKKCTLPAQLCGTFRCSKCTPPSFPNGQRGKVLSPAYEWRRKRSFQSPDRSETKLITLCIDRKKEASYSLLTK